MSTYYHGMTKVAEDMLADSAEISVYKQRYGINLLAFQDAENGFETYQFIQAMMNDTEGNRHYFLALKDINDVIIEKSLWSYEDMKCFIDKF